MDRLNYPFVLRAFYLYFFPSHFHICERMNHWGAPLIFAGYYAPLVVNAWEYRASGTNSDRRGPKLHGEISDKPIRLKSMSIRRNA
jgi:hypothetical protein